MATRTQTEEFQAGDPESLMKQRSQGRLNAGAKSCEYTGSQEEGWVLTTTWED